VPERWVVFLQVEEVVSMHEEGIGVPGVSVVMRKRWRMLFGESEGSVW
jgi:hypothetical protein